MVVVVTLIVAQRHWSLLCGIDHRNCHGGARRYVALIIIIAGLIIDPQLWSSFCSTDRRRHGVDRHSASVAAP